MTIQQSKVSWSWTEIGERRCDSCALILATTLYRIPNTIVTVASLESHTNPNRGTMYSRYEMPATYMTAGVPRARRPDSSETVVSIIFKNAVERDKSAMFSMKKRRNMRHSRKYCISSQTRDSKL